MSQMTEIMTAIDQDTKGRPDAFFFLSSKTEIEIQANGGFFVS